MKIYLNKKSMKEKKDIKTMLEELASVDCNFANTKYTIHKSDFPCNYIEDCDEFIGCKVLDNIEILVRAYDVF